MQFQPVSSLIEPSFWHALNRVKLNDKMLDETPFEITAYFQAGRTEGVKSFVFINEESFNEQKEQVPVHYLNVTGKLSTTVYLVNTKNQFKVLDRNSIMNDLKQHMVDTITSKQWLQNPSLLMKSAFTVFGDLKKWQYTYCFCFPNPIIDNVNILSESDDFGFFPSDLKYNNWISILSDDKKSLLPLTEAKRDSTLVIVDPTTLDIFFIFLSDTILKGYSNL